MEKKKWTPVSVLGLVLIVVFTITCIAPFIYMILMSFTKSTTLTLQLS